MFNLTKQEKLVLWWLAVIITTGSLLHYFFQKHSSLVDRFSFRQEQQAIDRVDLNAADLKQLTGLPQIGPVVAQRILDYRRQKGLFTRPEQLREIKGIGRDTYSKISPLIKITLPLTR